MVYNYLDVIQIMKGKNIMLKYLNLNYMSAQILFGIDYFMFSSKTYSSLAINL